MKPAVLPCPTRRRLLLAGGAGALLAAAPVAAASPRTVRWGYLNNYSPFSWVDRETRKLQGFHVDLGAELARQLGLSLELHSGSYAEMLQALRRQQIDVLGNYFTRVPDLLGEFVFTNGLQDFRLMLVQHENDDRTFLTLDEIPIARLGVLANTTVEDQVEAALGKGYRTYTRIDDALKDLAQEKLDAVIEEALIVEHLIHQQQLPVKTTTPMSAPVRLGMLLPKGSTELLGEINRGLAAMRQDGSAARISERWFGYDVTQRRAAGTYINPLNQD